MVSFRPHKIRICYKCDGYYDSNGDFVEGEDRFGPLISCRFEPNGRANSIALGDGRVFLYNYTVYLNTSCPEFKFGDMVEIFNQRGQCMGLFQVQGFHRGQLDSKLWV